MAQGFSSRLGGDGRSSTSNSQGKSSTSSLFNTTSAERGARLSTGTESITSGQQLHAQLGLQLRQEQLKLGQNLQR
jgi:hypothetical protein